MRVCACVVLMGIQIKKRDTVLCQGCSVSCFMDRDICCIAVFCGWTDDRNDVLAVKES